MLATGVAPDRNGAELIEFLVLTAWIVPSPTGFRFPVVALLAAQDPTRIRHFAKSRKCEFAHPRILTAVIALRSRKDYNAQPAATGLPNYP
jgi:hypothetical protein